MSSETLKLPLVDFSNQELKPGTPLWNSLKIQVRKSLEEYGCFEASFDKIPLQLRKDIFDFLPQIFDLPVETKVKNASGKPYHGYVQHPRAPLYESMGVDDANIPEKVESFTKILWPQGNSDFSNTVQSFSEQLSELDRMVRKMVLDSLGIEQYVDEHLESTNYLLRFTKYKAPQTDEAQLGLTSHTDKNVVTILCQNQVLGLQWQTKDGQWIDFKPSSDSFIVMIGESFHAWTNGRLHSAFHRVMIAGNETRYSIGLFSIPKAGYKIEAPKELVDEEHPLLFKPYDHVEFLRYWYSEEGQTAESPLKAYCGV